MNVILETIINQHDRSHSVLLNICICTSLGKQLMIHLTGINLKVDFQKQKFSDPKEIATAFNDYFISITISSRLI